MASFDVKPKHIQKTSSEIKNIAKQLHDVSNRIESVSKQLKTYQFQSMSSVRTALNRISSDNVDNAKKASLLSSSLAEIARAYEAAERAASNETSVSKATRDALARIRNTLGDIGGELGMDKGACYSDDPVNLTNGNYVYEKSFFDYDTPIAMKFRVFYNAADPENGALGKGWHHNFEYKFLIDNNEYRIQKEDGSAYYFIESEGKMKTLPGTTGVLSKTESGFVFTNEEGEKYTFDQEKRLTGIQTLTGWGVFCEYDGSLLTKVDCTDHICFSFEYNEFGKIRKISDQSGRSVNFSFKNNLLIGVTDPNGFETTYQYDERDRLYLITAENGDLSVENTYDEHSRTIRQKFADDGVVEYQYDDENQCVVLKRQNDTSVSYYHDEFYRTNRIVYPDGEEQIGYDIHNNRSSFTDKLGRVSRYLYDANGRLISMTNPAGNILQYEYTSGGQLQRMILDDHVLSESEYDDRGCQISNRNANGDATFYTYDDVGRVVEIVHENDSRTFLEYDENGNIKKIQDPVQGETSYRYDACHHVIESVDGLGNRTEYAYDANDQLISVTNAEGNTRIYAYDKRGNLIRITDFNGAVTEMAYNAMNQMVEVCDPDGHKTQFTYDKMAHPIQKRTDDGAVYHYFYDSEGRLTKIQHPMGETETAEYDAVGNLIRRIAPDGGEYRLSYDELDRLVAIEDPVKGTRSVEYDSLGNILTEYYEDGSEIRFSYDLMGNCLSKTDQNGYTQYFEYNSLGQVTRIFDDEIEIGSFAYNPGGQVIRESHGDGSQIFYEYNEIGKLIHVQDTQKGEFFYEYDCMGRVSSVNHIGEGIKTYKYNAQGEVIAEIDGEGNRTAFQYSPAGVLERVTDPSGNETIYHYDCCYRLTEVLQPESGGQLSEKMNCERRRISFEHDLSGNVVKSIDALGNVTRYQYDACGRLSGKTDAEGMQSKFSYRLDGLEETVTFHDGKTIRYQYNALKQLEEIEDWIGITRIHTGINGQIEEVIDPEGNAVNYEWNQRGQCIRTIYPDHSEVKNSYDDHMRLCNRTGEGFSVRYRYHENGLLAEKQFNDHFSVNYDYDQVGRIHSLTGFLEGKEKESLVYSYDACSRKSSIVRKGAFGSFRDCYSYTPNGFLSGIERNGEVLEKYEYDSFGNRIRMQTSEGEVGYEYDRNNQLLKSIAHNKVTSFYYDKRGNLIERHVDGIRNLVLQFDALDRLTGAVAADREAHYTYNGLAQLSGVCIREGQKERQEKYFYDLTNANGHLLSRKTEEGFWKNYIWDADQPLMGFSGVNYDNYFSDEKGIPIGVWRKGEDWNALVYDAFGQRMTEQKADFGFGGFWEDSVTGFYQAGWRQYDCTNGRFISRDPVPGTVLYPVSQNRFLFGMSDPINFTDPTGELATWLAGGIVGAVIDTGFIFAGDVIRSVKNGKWTPSSWQTYAGSVVGGFTRGSVTAIAGPAAGGAAGDAATTFVTNGLNMVSGVEGYRKEDGYNLGKLAFDTGKAAAFGAASGSVFNWKPKHVKISGITKGKGSYLSVWKQLMKKSQNGTIKNIKWKSLYKGLVAMGICKTADTIIDKGLNEVKDTMKKWGLNMINSTILSGVLLNDHINWNGGGNGLFDRWISKSNATCATA